MLTSAWDVLNSRQLNGNWNPHATTFIQRPRNNCAGRLLELSIHSFPCVWISYWVSSLLTAHLQMHCVLNMTILSITEYVTTRHLYQFQRAKIAVSCWKRLNLVFMVFICTVLGMILLAKITDIFNIARFPANSSFHIFLASELYKLPSLAIR